MSFRKGLLATAFALTAGIAVAAAQPAINRRKNREADDEKYPVARARGLTEKETALIRGIFGGELDTSKVKACFSEAVKPSRKQGYIVAATTFGKKRVKFYSPQYDAKDYTETESLYNYGTFVHEMVHIWQNQRGLKRDIHKKLHPTTEYSYTLTEKSRFADFGEEQQASMIEDYARQVLHKDGNPAAAEYLPSFAGLDKNVRRSLPLLIKVVEERFPAARATRLSLNRQPPAPKGPQ